MKKQLLRIIFFIGIITLFLILNILLQTDNGTFLHESEFTTFENKLLKPEDIENEIGLTETVTGVTHSYWDESDYSRVRTSYYDIELEDGKVYGIYGENLTYAFDLYINGELIASKGKVGDSEKTSFPQTGSFTAYFTAKAVNRIVVRRCNFVHSKWNNFGIYLGPMNVISRYADIRKIESIILVVIILTMSLVNLGIFVGLNGQKRFLFFSFVCLSFMINLLFADPKPIMILIPELNWFVGHKIESCSLITAAFFFIFNSAASLIALAILPLENSI